MRRLPALIRRRAHHQPVEFGRHLDLAGQPRVRPHVEGGVKLFFLFGAGGADLVGPGFIDVDVTGRAGAAATAFGDDARNVVAQRGFHHGRAEFGFDIVHGAVMFDESDLGHGR